MLEGRREDERLAQVLGILVHGKTRTEGRDLEEDAARLAEVDRAEPEAVDDWSRSEAGRCDALAPRLVLVQCRRPGDVVHGSGPAEAALRGG